MRLEEATKIAEKLKAHLQVCCHRIEIAGSIRRRKPIVGDIELLCIPRGNMLEKELQDMMMKNVLAMRLNKQGRRAYGPKNKLMVHLPSGIGVDIFSTDEECWFVSLVVRTGGAMTNKEIASRALKRGMRFHAYGKGFTQADGSELICRSEAAVFRAVGLAYKEPWERR